MYQLLFTLLYLSIAVTGNAQPVFSWAKSLSGNNNNDGNSIAVDAKGNIYVTGLFNGTTDFDPGPATYDLTAIYYDNVFVTKSDSLGNFIWSKMLGGHNCYGYYEPAVAVDNSGNVIVTNYFSSTCDFDPGPGTFTLSANMNTIAFVTKLDSTGSFVWAFKLGYTGYSDGYSVETDSDDNIYVTGSFSDSIDFDPGPGNYTLYKPGMGSNFIAKYTGGGHLIWARNFGTGTTRDIVVTQEKGVIVTGYYSGTADFDPGNGVTYLTGAGNGDIFICKLDSTGNYLWAKGMGGPGDDYGFSVECDISGNVYTTGQFKVTADFDPGPGTFTLSANNGTSAFVSKLDVNGNFVWVKKIGGSYGTYGYCIDVNEHNGFKITVTGWFAGTTDFDPGPLTFTLSSYYNSAYIAQLNYSGDFICAGKIGGNNEVLGRSICSDKNGAVFVTGVHSGLTDFDPGSGTYTIQGSQYIFLSKYSPCQLGVSITGLTKEEIKTSAEMQIYPNPSNGLIKIYSETSTVVSICVYNSLGDCIHRAVSFNPKSEMIDLTSLSKGIYFMEIRSGNKIRKEKIILN